MIRDNVVRSIEHSKGEGSLVEGDLRPVQYRAL